jgi:hypothetical protein
VLRKVIDALRTEGITRGILAKDLCIVQEDMDNLTFGFILLSVSSGLPLALQTIAVPYVDYSVKLAHA